MKPSFMTILGTIALFASAPIAATAVYELQPAAVPAAHAADAEPGPGAAMGRGMMQGGTMQPGMGGAIPMQQGQGSMMPWGENGGMPMAYAVMASGMPGYGMTQGYGMMRDRGMMSMMGMVGDPDGMVRHIEGRIAFIKAELQITPAQEQRWDAFADALRYNAKATNASMRGLMQTGATAMPLPGQLEQYERILAIRVDGLRKTREALLPLYAVLTETQRQTADNMFLGPLGM